MAEIIWTDDIFDNSLAAIYQITIGTHKYIGSTKRNPKIRISEHLYLLEHGKHYNKKLQACYDAHDSAKFYILEYTSEIKIWEREQWYVDHVHPDLNIIQKIAKY